MCCETVHVASSAAAYFVLDTKTGYLPGPAGHRRALDATEHRSPGGYHTFFRLKIMVGLKCNRPRSFLKAVGRTGALASPIAAISRYWYFFEQTSCVFLHSNLFMGCLCHAFFHICPEFALLFDEKPTALDITKQDSGLGLIGAILQCPVHVPGVGCECDQFWKRKAGRGIPPNSLYLSAIAPVLFPARQSNIAHHLPASRGLGYLRN